MQDLVILNNIDLSLKSGNSYLLMGPPCSGTSSLLKSLNSYFKKSQVKGSISCNGKSIYEMNWKNLSTYCGQLDISHPFMTVEETFKFVIDCLYPKPRGNKDGFTELEESAKHKVEAFEYLFGLDNCKDTIVGNELNRGCSGGERKRVTVCESILGQSRVFLLDKISTGLDSAVTFDICKFLTYWTKTMEGIMVCHLTQPDPQVIDLFDKVIIMEEGNIIYFGKARNSINYFSNLNCHLPEGRDYGSFISEMGHLEGRKEYIKDKAEPAKTKEEVLEFYKKSDGYNEILKEIGEDQMQLDPKDDVYRKIAFNNFKHNYFHTIGIMLHQQWIFITRNKFYYINRYVQLIFLAFILGSVFANNDSYIVKMGLLNFMMMGIVLIVNPGVVMLFNQKLVVYKQLNQKYFDPSHFVIATTLVDYPTHMIDVFIYGTLIYSIVGLTWSGHGIHYFYSLIIFYVTLLAFESYFKIFVFLLEHLPVLQAIFPFINFTTTTLSGFSITKNKIPLALIPFYWFSPIQFGVKDLVLNEYLSSDYSDIYPGTNLTRGQVYLKQYEFPITMDSFWFNILMLVVEHIVFTIIQIFVLKYVRYDPYPASVSVDRNEIKSISDEVQEFKINRASSSRQELPFKSACFTFKDVNYYVTIKDKETKKKVEKQLLCGVSGFVKPTSMVALMGASGAGKTTLLDVLANRKTQGRIEGSFLINGKDYTINDLCKISGYVEQDDTLPTSETVREALMFSARMRVGGNIMSRTVERFVDEMIYLLELEDYQNLLIGKPGSGLPVGIRKLVMVGIELVANPAIIFLDEPTTGLDSSAALLVCKVLQRIAATGRSIICTIHQPSEEVFTLFTDILLLERGGKVVYFGQSEKSKKMVEYFQSLPGVMPKMQGVNPATWMLDTIGAGVQIDNGINFSESYRNSNLYSTAMSKLADLEFDKSQSFTLDQSYPSSFYFQCKMVTERTFRMNYRRLDYNLKRYQVSTAMAIIFGLIYFQVDTIDQAGAQSKFSSVFMTTMFLGINNLFSNIPVLMEQRAIFYRETSMRTYHPIAQLVGNFLAECVFTFILVFFFHTVFYFLVGFRPDIVNYLLYIFTCFIWVLLCVLSGQFLTYSAARMEITFLIGTLIFILWVTLAGFLVPYKTMGMPWKPLYWIFPCMYTVQGILTNEFKGDMTMLYNIPYEPGKLGNFTLSAYFESVIGIRYDYQMINIVVVLGYILMTLIVTGLVMTFCKFVHR